MSRSDEVSKISSRSPPTTLNTEGQPPAESSNQEVSELTRRFNLLGVHGLRVGLGGFTLNAVVPLQLAHQ